MSHKCIMLSTWTILLVWPQATLWGVFRPRKNAMLIGLLGLLNILTSNYCVHVLRILHRTWWLSTISPKNVTRFQHLWHLHWWVCFSHLGVSKNRGTPKWMIYNGNPYWNGWFGGTTIFGNPHLVFLLQLGYACEILPSIGNFLTATSISSKTPSQSNQGLPIVTRDSPHKKDKMLYII